MKPEKRKIIGVCIDWIESPYHIKLITELEMTAKYLGINLLTFVGGALHSPKRFEAHCNGIYDFVERDTVDGILLVSGSLVIFFIPGIFTSLPVELRNVLQEKM